MNPAEICWLFKIIYMQPKKDPGIDSWGIPQFSETQNMANNRILLLYYCLFERFKPVIWNTVNTIMINFCLLFAIQYCTSNISFPKRFSVRFIKALAIEKFVKSFVYLFFRIFRVFQLWYSNFGSFLRVYKIIHYISKHGERRRRTSVS